MRRVYLSFCVPVEKHCGGSSKTRLGLHVHVRQYSAVNEISVLVSLDVCFAHSHFAIVYGAKHIFLSINSVFIVKRVYWHQPSLALIWCGHECHSKPMLKPFHITHSTLTHAHDVKHFCVGYRFTTNFMGRQKARITHSEAPFPLALNISSFCAMPMSLSLVFIPPFLLSSQRKVYFSGRYIHIASVHQF